MSNNLFNYSSCNFIFKLGTVSVNGGSSSASNSGGGSGGSLLMTAAVLEGHGVFSSIGGNAPFGGSGGRIAVYTNKASKFEVNYEYFIQITCFKCF